MLRVENLTVRAGDFLLQSVSLELHPGECGVVVGPSGAGKSTLLEAIAGLRQIVSGRIFLSEREITTLPPEQRGIAFVPQDYALFPHLTAQGNILLAPRLLRLPREEVTKRFEFLCDLLNLRDLLQRRPHQLSGGERQRVALARALMLQPQLLLLDEPFAALDPQMRPVVRRSLRQVFRTLQQTVLMVTHDLWDAAMLGDRVFVIENGRIVQQGSWAEVTANPQSDFVAEFVGLNRLKGTVIRRGGQTFLQVGTTELPVETNLPDETPALLQFFPSQIQLLPAPSVEAWTGQVEEVVNLGDRTQLLVTISPEVFVRVEVANDCIVSVGDTVAFRVLSSPQQATAEENAQQTQPQLLRGAR